MLNQTKYSSFPSLINDITMINSPANEIINAPKRILAIAYACNPYKGSEHGVGWGWVKMISELHDVHVIAADFERDDVERWLNDNSGYREKMTFSYPKHKIWHYNKNSKFWVWIEHSPFKIIMNGAYRLWQADAYCLSKKLHAATRFDLCHLITYVGFRFPGRFYKLDCPFVWGPVGALENTPKHFLPLLGRYGAVYYSFRNLINNFDKRFLKHPRKSFKKAAQTGTIISATSGIKKEIKKWYGEDSEVICEIGTIGANDTDRLVVRDDGDPLHICWSGTHTPGKALQLLLAALARLPSSLNWSLNILGEGPCSKKWKKTAVDLKIAANCCFLGNVPRSEALAVMRSSHLFVITSLKDLTSTVLLEALSLGKPVIAPDHCGFSDVITETCGVKISIDNVDAFVAQLSKEIEGMYTNESDRIKMAAGAVRRSSDFNWVVKAEHLNQLYHRARKCENEEAK